MNRLTTGLVASVLVLAGCGDDGGATSSPITVDPAQEATTTTEDPSTTTTTEDPTAAIEQAYYDQWDAFVEILSDPDPANPLIDKHFAGAAKEKLLDSVSRFVQNGTVAALPLSAHDFRPRVESIEMNSSDSAMVVECLVDGLRVLERASGRVLNDNVKTLRIKNEFRYRQGTWKIVSSTTVDELGPGACDA